MKFKWDQAFGRTVTSLVATLGLSASLSAYDGTNMRDSCKKEKPQSNFGFSYPKDLDLCDPYDFFFHVEGLAFQAMETGTSFLISNKAAVGTSLTNASIGGFSGEDNNWGYNFGTRIGAGGIINHDAWNVDATWTWLNMTDSQKFTASSPGALIPLWFPGVSATITSAASGARASGTWQCIMNVLDTAMGKAYHVSRKVVFNPHFGLRFAWLNHHYGAHYSGTGIVSDPNNIFHAKNDFWGVGARFGVDTDWMLGYGFKLFANASTSILSGKFKINEKFTLPSSVPAINVNLTDDFHMNVPNLEISLGADWGTYLDCNRYYLCFRAGYEFQVWWDQFNVRKISGGAIDGSFQNDAVSRGTLSLNGFTLRVQLDI